MPRKQFKKRQPLKKVLKKYVKKADLETKYYDDVEPLTAVAQAITNQTFVLTDIAEGTTSSERVGRKLEIKSLMLNYTISLSSLVNAHNIRVLVVQWGTNGTPSLSQILQNTDNFQCINSPYLMGNGQKYKVLYDRVHNAFTEGPDNRRWHVSKLIKGWSPQIEYTGSAGANRGQGNIYMFWMADFDSSGTSSIGYYSRLKYRDA